MSFRPRLKAILRPSWDPTGPPKRSPKRTKIEPKNQHKKRCSSRPSWGRLGAILGRSRSHLGVNFVNFLLENVIFRENRRFRKKVVSRRVLGRSWVDLARQKGSKTRPLGSKLGSKRVRKSEAKKGLVLGGQGGDLPQLVVGSL